MSHDDADSAQEVPNLVWTIVVAGGSGLRFGERKQFATLAGRSVLERTVESSRASSDSTVVVVPDDAVATTQDMFGGLSDVDVVAGGATRASSVRAGLAATDDGAGIILVHDGARPLASPALFTRVVERVRLGAAAVIPVVPLADSIRHVDGHVVDRSKLQAVQTPQGFTATALRGAHASGAEATDDATLVSDLGYEVATVEGEPENRKLTVPSDMITAEAIVLSRHDSEEPHVDNP